MSHLPGYSSWRGGCAALALCALAPVLSAQRAHPSPAPLFALEWGMPADSLVQKATASGWQFMTIDEDGDYAFHGRFDGEEALIFATVGEKGLTRLLISVSPHAGANVTFGRIADTLRTYFGPAALNTGDDQEDVRPARSMLAATAWEGILMGLRRDSRILILFTCPSSTPALPIRKATSPIA
ncbi:MAG: hypothetical protein ACT4P6_15500 [Gemmatimonadaceae bacterium]